MSRRAIAKVQPHEPEHTMTRRERLIVKFSNSSRAQADGYHFAGEVGRVADGEYRATLRQ
jgi:hypothetical protein